MSYDRATFALANYFLLDAGGTEKDIAELAQQLQDACEAACDRVEERNAADRLDGTVARGMRAFTGGKP